MPSNFLLTPGTNGFIATPFDLMTTEMNSLGSGNAATSSVGGSSGVFSQSNTVNAMFGSLWFTAGGAFTPTAGGFLAGWFLRSTNGGTTFEDIIATASTTQPALPRAPDFTIPVFENAAFSANKIKWAQGGHIRLPWESFKVVIQNLSGVALSASGHKLTLGPVAMQY